MKEFTMFFIEQGINKSYETAKKHGFYKNTMSISHCLMMIITEVCKAIQAHRKCNYGNLLEYQEMRLSKDIKDAYECTLEGTTESELADVAIRIMSLIGYLNDRSNVKLMSDKDLLFHRDTFLYCLRHGNYSFTEIMFNFTQKITNHELETSPAWLIANNLQLLLAYLYAVATYLKMDLAEHISIKMEYNETREYHHNCKY